MKAIEIEVSLEELQSVGQQLGLERGPLSPILEAKPDRQTEPVSNTALVTKTGKPLKSVIPVFEILAKPEIASGVIMIAPETIIDVALFSRAVNGEQVSVALYKGQAGLWLHCPAPKSDILGMLYEALNAASFQETPIELDARTSPGAAWVLWSMMDLLRPVDGAIPKEAEKGFTTKQIQDRMNAEIEGLWNLAAYYQQALELPEAKKGEPNAWCAELAEKGFLEKARAKWKPTILLRAIVEDLFPLRSHVHFKMSAQAPAGGIGSMRFWGLQGESGTCLLWHTLPGETQMLSTGTWNLMAILQRMVEQPEFVFAPEEGMLDLAATQEPEAEPVPDALAQRPEDLPEPPERLFPSAPPERL
jgi:hypothetical protein